MRKRIEMCPSEWSDDFGEEFYEELLQKTDYCLVVVAFVLVLAGEINFILRYTMKNAALIGFWSIG